MTHTDPDVFGESGNAEDPPHESGPGVLDRIRRRERVLAELAVLVVLGVCVIAFFWPLVNGHMFSTVGGAQNGILPWAARPSGLPRAIQDDSATLNFGWQTYATTVLRAGSFPFWNSDNFGGYAIFSNGSSGFGDPLRLILAWSVEPAVAHELISILYLSSGGVLAYWLGRELGLSRWGALLVGTAWMLSSWNLGWLHLEVVAPVIAFFPAGLLLMRRAILRSQLGWVALAAVVLGWSLVSAHLLFALVTWTICMLYGLALVLWPLAAARTRDRRSSAGRAGRLGAVAVLSVGVAAPVLVPTWRMLSASQRVPLTYEVLRSTWVGEVRTFLHAFLPPSLPLSMDEFNADLVFVGTATAVLGLVGLFAVRQPAAALGRALAVGLILVIVGTPLTWVVFTFVPGMDVFRPYTRLVMWWSLGIALLAGAGLDIVIRRARRWPRWVGAGIAIAVISVTAVQLLDFGRAVNPPFPQRDSALLFPPTPLVSAMKERPTTSAGWPIRHAGVRGPQDEGWSPSMLFANTNLAVGLDSITGYDSALPARTSDVVRVLAGEQPDAVLAAGLEVAYAPALDVGNARLDLLGRLGVSQVALAPGLDIADTWAEPLRDAGAVVSYQGGDGTVVDLDEAGPRLVGGTVTVDDRRDALRTFTAPAFDPTGSVVVESSELGRLADGTRRPGSPGPAGEVLAADRSVNGARIVVDADRPSWLLVPDGWAPGWSASVDGESAAVLQANYYQRAVLVPAGRSEVTFSYRPDGWSSGVAIGVVSALLVVLLGAVAVAGWLRARRSDGQSEPAATGEPGNAELASR